MITSSQSITFKKCLGFNQLRILSKALSSASVAFAEKPKPQTFRTNETNPANHTPYHVGQFYEISEPVRKNIFTYGGLPKSFQEQTKTFAETCLMIREPAVEVIETISKMDFQKPIVRFVLYGKLGTGKSITLAHLLHYAFQNDFLIVHVPWVSNWMRRCKEFNNSATKEGFVDLPIDAAAWLLHFRSQNLKHLEKLTTSKDYVWSKRETTPKGSKFVELVDHGINRVKYASDCIVILAEEIKLQSQAGNVKTFIGIDGFNAFFYPHTRVYTDAKVAVPPKKVTLTEAFLNLTKPDWSHSVAVLAVDEMAIPANDHGSHYPFYLLSKEGFEHLDPFVPIPIENYSKKEFESCIMYYRDRLWIQPRPQIDPQLQNEELAVLSNLNPYDLMRLCAPL